MTIEERARDYACHVSIEELKNEGLDAESFCGILHGYTRGATDQKGIDIDKACEWLSQCESLQMRPYNIELFREAMER